MPEDWWPAVRGVPLITKGEGMSQIEALGLDLVDVATLLETAEACAESPRGRDIFELCATVAGVRVKFVGKRVEHDPWTEGPALYIWHAKPVKW